MRRCLRVSLGVAPFLLLQQQKQAMILSYYFASGSTPGVARRRSRPCAAYADGALAIARIVELSATVLPSPLKNI